MSLANQLGQIKLKSVQSKAKENSEDGLGKVVNFQNTDVSKLKCVPLNINKFDATSQEWKPVAPEDMKLSELPFEIRILTWNIWIYQVNLDARIEALISFVKEHDIHIMAFQELQKSHHELLYKNDYLRQHYYCSDLTNQFSDFKTALYSKFPISSLECLDMYASPRKMLLGKIDFLDPSVNNNQQTQETTSLMIGSVHLQSEGHSKEAREQQLNFIIEHAKSRNVVIMGDFNMASKSEDAAFEKHGFVDVWKKERPSEPGNTFDGTCNSQAAMTTSKFFKARLDRVTVKMQDFKAENIEMVGTKPINSEGALISDHFGLMCTIKKN